MNLDALQQRLLDAGRAQPPPDTVPYRFEQRILTTLRTPPTPDPAALWNRILWRATAPCLTLMLLTGAWSWWNPTPSPDSDDLAVDLETALYAPFDDPEAAW